MEKFSCNIKIFSLCLLSIAILVIFVPQIFLFPHITDDAYISFRYATRLAEGHGLTFNPGEWVEGFSNPLWTLLISVIIRLTPFAAPDIARWLGLLCTILTIITIWRIFHKNGIRGYEGRSNFIVCATIVLLNPGFHVYATAGLETPLFTYLLILGVALSLSDRDSHHYLAALSFGFSSITRPEGLLYGLLWFVSTLKRSDKKLSIRYEAERFTILLLPFMAYQVFRLCYFKALVPNTAIAKPPGTFGYMFGLPYLYPWIQSLGGVLIFLLLILFPVRKTKCCQMLYRACVGPIAAGIIFVAYAQGDWMPFGRFIVPIWPLVAIVVSVWVHSLIESLKEIHFLRFKRSAKFVVAVVLMLASLFTWREEIELYLRNYGLRMLMRGTDQVAVGEWLAGNVSKGTTVATGRLGGISYAAPDIVFWDTEGLTDREQAQYIAKGRPGGFESDPIWNRAPEVIAATEFSDSRGYTRDLKLFQWLKDNYTFVRSFPQGTCGSIDIWISKKSLSILHFDLPTK